MTKFTKFFLFVCLFGGVFPPLGFGKMSLYENMMGRAMGGKGTGRSVRLSLY